MIKANFETKEKVEKDEPVIDKAAEFRKKALENIGGSMVFVEREQLYWDGKLAVLYDKKSNGEGKYCCPMCLYWYDTSEEKASCMENNHGYTVLNIYPKDKP